MLLRAHQQASQHLSAPAGRELHSTTEVNSTGCKRISYFHSVEGQPLCYPLCGIKLDIKLIIVKTFFICDVKVLNSDFSENSHGLQKSRDLQKSKTKLFYYYFAGTLAASFHP